uniref:DUF4283 domain-containing protein n=1 Tax=Strongyloides venezuelensis TaxID=75913 RepID=A0A0K0FZD2_STRVS
MFAAYTILNFVKKRSQKSYGTEKGRESKVPQLTGGIKDSIDGSEKLPTVKNSSTIGKKGRSDKGKSEEVKKQPKVVFSFEELIKAMYDGQVQILLANYDLQGVPHRGIMVKNMCVSLIAVLSNQEIKNGKIVDQEVVNIPSGRRLVPNVGVIKAYESNQHESMVKMLTSKNWELIEFNAFTEGQQPLFKNVSTKVLIIKLRSSCMNMSFLACKKIEFLWWNSNSAGRGMLSHFPALKGVAYSDCHFLKKVAISFQVKILMCFSKNCKCDFRIVMKQRRKPYVFNCPASCMDGPATLAYADLPDIWRFD